MVAHCIYDAQEGAGEPGLRCICGTGFGTDAMAALAHLPAVLRAFPWDDPRALISAMATAIGQASVWLQQVELLVLAAELRRDDDTVPGLKAHLGLTGITTARARRVLAGLELKEGNSPCTPHTAAYTVLCLRCGKDHTEDAAARLNEREEP